ncbi:MAG: SDR family oxidoreductase [Myxococcota bacterium]|nr:SDR family oxidoreductase [Myxococcota bacterium]
MVDFSLNDKIAVITGASRGIGEAIAKTLAENGAHCILTSRKPDALETVVTDIKNSGGSAEAIACHNGHLDQIKSLFEEIEKRFGKLDILVNNAATNPHFGDLASADEGMWDKIFDVNLKGPFFMIQHAVPLMEKSGKGAIVNISSVNGIRPALGQGVYSISKAGIISMTLAYAKELASSNIRVNAVLPGLTETKFARALLDNKMVYDIAIQMIPMQRHAQPEEMTGLVLYLVSDASSYTTGSVIPVDGGMLA